MKLDQELEVIASLARAVHDNPNPDLLASHLALRVLGHLECRAVAIGVIQKEGFLDLIGNYGLAHKTTSPYQRMPLWNQLPMTEAARTGKLVYIKNYQEFAERFPTMIASIEHPAAITVASPIMHRNLIIGSIAFACMKSPSEDFMKHPMTDAALAIVGLYIRNFMDKQAESNRENSISTKGLSERQRKIIRLFREGLTTDQMADRLRFSPSTIKQDIIKIYDIFGVNTREEVVSLAERGGLLEPNKAS